MKIEKIEIKEWNGRKFAEIIADGKKLSCWQGMIGTLKEGDEVEGQLIDKGEGKTPQIKISKVNGQALQISGKSHEKDPKSFCASYAKDIVVQLVASGLIKEPDKLDVALDHYYTWFEKKLIGG